MAVRTGGCAGSVNGADVWRYGVCTNTQSTWFHEATHNIDCQHGPTKSTPGSVEEKGMFSRMSA